MRTRALQFLSVLFLTVIASMPASAHSHRCKSGCMASVGGLNLTAGLSGALVAAVAGVALVVGVVVLIRE